MLKKILILLGVLVVILLILSGFAIKSLAPKIEIPDQLAPTELQSYVAKVVKDNKLPAMAVAVIDSEGTRHLASAGLRKHKGTKAVTDQDLFHLGSNTKAMTSVLVGMCIDEGLLNWHTTIGDVFKDHLKEIHADYHNVSVHELVTHTSGIDANAINWWAYKDIDMVDRRFSILKENLKEASKNTKGEYLYSNLGYMIAGSILEELNGKSWETLMQEKLFDRLDMKSAGFGVPGTIGEEDQPWGHNVPFIINDWNPVQFDNAEALGPAGTVHCNLEDWGKFVAFQLLNQDTTLLSQEQRDILLTPVEDDYACGWSVLERSWANGLAYNHAGSNTMNYALVWAAPGTNRAYLVCTNAMATNTPQICDKMIGALMKLDE